MLEVKSPGQQYDNISLSVSRQVLSATLMTARCCLFSHIHAWWGSNSTGSICCQQVYKKICNKSTTNRTNGVWAL